MLSNLLSSLKTWAKDQQVAETTAAGPEVAPWGSDTLVRRRYGSSAAAGVAFWNRWFVTRMILYGQHHMQESRVGRP